MFAPRHCWWLVVAVVAVEGGFPTAFGGCDDPTSIPLPHRMPKLPAGPLPDIIERAIKQVEVAAGLIQQTGIDPIASGLDTLPTVGLSVGALSNETIIWSRGFGLRDADGEHVNPLGGAATMRSYNS